MPRKPDPDSLDRFIEAGLPSLREVPPMQMSPERLRDAVLAGGLSPAPRPSALAWVPWLVAPLAAATVALAVVPRLPRAEAPTLVSPTIVRPGAVAFRPNRASDRCSERRSERRRDRARRDPGA